MHEFVKSRQQLMIVQGVLLTTIQVHFHFRFRSLAFNILINLSAGADTGEG